MLDPLRLSSLPYPVRLTLTVFLALIGLGYLAALGNLYSQHELADGRPGLTFDDLRVTFHGATIAPAEPHPVPSSQFPVPSSQSPVPSAQPNAVGRVSRPDAPSPQPMKNQLPPPPDTRAPIPDPRPTPSHSRDTPVPHSRMLEMTEPGGDMRKHLIKGGLPAVRALTAWLERGAPRESFERAGLVEADDPSASGVIAENCLNCHNADSGEKKDTPYGPDLFTVDYEMVNKYAAPGTARAAGSAENSARPDHPQSKIRNPKSLGPMPLSHLFLITHAHVLTIPVFTLIVAMLFFLSDASARTKTWLGPAPMITVLFDILSWWLARAFEPALLVIAAAGGIFGACLAAQIVWIVIALWRPGAPARAVHD